VSANVNVHDAIGHAAIPQGRRAARVALSQQVTDSPSRFRRVKGHRAVASGCDRDLAYHRATDGEARHLAECCGLLHQICIRDHHPGALDEYEKLTEGVARDGSNARKRRKRLEHRIDEVNDVDVIRHALKKLDGGRLPAAPLLEVNEGKGLALEIENAEQALDPFCIEKSRHGVREKITDESCRLLGDSLTQESGHGFRVGDEEMFGQAVQNDVNTLPTGFAAAPGV